jgi:hypothetical protein
VSSEVVVQLPEPTERDLYVDRGRTRTSWSGVSVYSDGTMQLVGYGYLRRGPAQARKIAADLLAAAAFAEALPAAGAS